MADEPAVTDRRRWPTAAAWWLGTFTVTFWIVHSMLRPLIGPYAIGLDMGAGLVGFIIGVQALPAIAFAIPLGSQLDRHGPRRMLVMGTAFMAAGGVVLVNATTALSLVVSQALSGFGTLAVWLTIQSLMTFGGGDADRRTRSIANYSLCVITGQLLGPLVGGAIADTFGYLASFVTYATVGTGLILGAAVRVPYRSFSADRGGQTDRRSPTDAGGHTARTSSHRDALGLLRERGVLLTVLVTFVALFLMDLRMSFVPVFLQSISWTPSLIGVLLSFSSAFALISRPVYPMLVRRFGNATVIALCLLPGAICLGLLAQTESIVLIFVLAAIAGMTLGIAQPLTLSLTAEFTRPQQRGLAIALRVLGNRTALWLSPVAFGLMISTIGIRAAFAVGTAVIAVAAVAVCRRFSRLAPDTSPAPPP